MGTRKAVNLTIAGEYMTSAALNAPNRNGPDAALRSRASCSSDSISAASASASTDGCGGCGRKHRLNDIDSRSFVKPECMVAASQRAWARRSGSEGQSAGWPGAGNVSSRYSMIARESGMTRVPWWSTGSLAVGETRRLCARSLSTRSSMVLSSNDRFLARSAR